MKNIINTVSSYIRIYINYIYITHRPPVADGQEMVHLKEHVTDFFRVKITFKVWTGKKSKFREVPYIYERIFKDFTNRKYLNSSLDFFMSFF
jgi:hypothetical protein